MYNVKNRFGTDTTTRAYPSLDGREGVGRTGFMGQGTLMSSNDKAIFQDMVVRNADRYVSVSHVYTINPQIRI